MIEINGLGLSYSSYPSKGTNSDSAILARTSASNYGTHKGGLENMGEANGLTSLVDVARPSFRWLGRCEFQYVSHWEALVFRAGFVENHGHVHLTLDRVDIFLGEDFSVKPDSIQVGLELASNVEDVQVFRF